MELILIRHGEAEEQTTTIKDAQRNLTAKGAKGLKKAMPHLHLFIKKKKTIQIWTSPLLRASETANIVANSLGVKDIEFHECIALGDFEGLSQVIKNRQPSDYLIIVGHEPHLSHWSSQLCGNTLPFQKGTSAGFLLDSADPTIGKLKWLLTLKTLSGLNHGLDREL